MAAVFFRRNGAETAPCAGDAFLFGIVPGVPATAVTPEKLIVVLAHQQVDRAVDTLFPERSRTEIVRGDRGYYCRVVVPLPNLLPDLVAVA